MSGRGTRSAVLFLAAGAVAACGLGACRRGALGESDAGGGTLTGAGGAAPASGAGGAGGSGVAAGAAGAVGPGGAGGAVADSCQSGSTYSYLVRSLVAFEVDGGNLMLHGFDLDGRASDGTAPEDCRVADRSAPDGRVGIDNTVGGFWGEDFRPLFDTSYAQGHAPIVIRLSGVDGFDNDDCVSLEWFGAEWVGAPLDPASLDAVARQLRPAGPIARLPGARIEAGRLLVDGAAPTTLHATLGTRTLAFPLVLTRIAFTVGSVELTQGELGGRVKPEDVHSAYQSIAVTPISRELIDSILFPDLPSGQPCALLSAGFGFEAVRVTIVP